MIESATASIALSIVEEVYWAIWAIWWATFTLSGLVLIVWTVRWLNSSLDYIFSHRIFEGSRRDFLVSLAHLSVHIVLLIAFLLVELDLIMSIEWKSAWQKATPLSSSYVFGFEPKDWRFVGEIAILVGSCLLLVLLHKVTRTLRKPDAKEEDSESPPS